MTNDRRARVPDGVFVADVEVFRFYPDGTVLHVLVKPAPTPEHGDQIAAWLRRDNPLAGVDKTTYERDGRRIAFTTVNPVDGHPLQVTATCHGDELVADLHAPGNPRRGVTFQRIWQ